MDGMSSHRSVEDWISKVLAGVVVSLAGDVLAGVVVSLPVVTFAGALASPVVDLAGTVVLAAAAFAAATFALA